MDQEPLNHSRKRKTTASDEIQSKRARNYGSSSDEEDDMINELVPGKIKRIFLKNFMCHDALEMKFNSRINFLVGVNGSGKSAILTALTVGLGARARDTDRGASLKGFIKQGKNSAKIEITITNRGDHSYEWKTYGDSITVVRTIGATSTYRIKSHTGQVISTKKEELDAITNGLNIQVDNPISILNQDAARSFLLSNKPDDLYKFYMRATRLDTVGENYKIAQAASDHAKAELAKSRKFLKESEKNIQELSQKLKALESLDKHRDEFQELQKEILWAAVVAEEKILLQIDKKIDQQNNEIIKLENVESIKISKENEIDTQIEELKVRIAEHQAEATASNEMLQDVKQKAINIRKTWEDKREKVRKFHQNIKDKEDDLNLLLNDIKEKEKAECDVDVKRQEARRLIEEYEQLLDEVDATLRTKQTDLMHLEENKSRISQEENNVKIEIDQKRMELNRKRHNLHAFENQPNDALAVYGNSYPRLVRRIEEEHKRGRFRKKPVGPLGAYISIKDKTWIPAIESQINPGMLKSFCVDNCQDRAILINIINEIFVHEPHPSVITSRFIDRIHDVSKKSTRSSKYPNILDMMDIKDVTVANTLIDQREIERILLIPTSEEASIVMSNFRKVPPNCRRAITKMNDLFYPDPNYKTYGGSAGRARFLQVSTAQAIQRLKEEVAECENKLRFLQEQYSEILQRKTRTHQEHNEVQKLVRNLLGKQSHLTKEIEENKETLECHNNNIIHEHKLEVEQIRKWLDHNKQEEARMMEEFRELDRKSKDAAADYKKCRECTTNVDVVLNPLKEKIHDLQDEKKRLDVINKGATKRLQEAKQLLQRLKGEHQQQQRVVTTKASVAIGSCPRVDTTKTVIEIVSRSNELKKFIEDVEKEHGNKQSLLKELQEEKEKYRDVQEEACSLQIMHERHIERMKIRKYFYSNMKVDVAAKVQDAFSNILSLRNYKGTVAVDHNTHKLSLEMAPINDAKRQTNNTKSLSGGERSYSTIGFILALWHCTGLPFYFLDEFDVFMDKINRRMIIDILIHHAENNPNSQYTFLTPLDASHVKANNSITIHRMAPPERLG